MPELSNPYRTRALLARAIRAASPRPHDADPFAGVHDTSSTTWPCACCGARVTFLRGGLCAPCGQAGQVAA